MRNIKKRTEEKWTEHQGPVGHHQADQHTDTGSPRRKRDSETGRIFKEIMDKFSIFDKSLEYKYQRKQNTNRASVSQMKRAVGSDGCTIRPQNRSY